MSATADARSWQRAVGVSVAFVAVFASSSVAFAFPPGACSTSWGGGEVDVYVNVRSFTDQGYSDAAIEHIVRGAIDKWSVAGRSDIRMRFAGRDDYSVALPGDYCAPYDPGQDVIVQMNPGADPLAPGTQGAVQCDGFDAGPCCLRIWAAPTNTTWSDGWPSSSFPELYSLMGVINHEIGHTLCLAHSDDDPLFLFEPLAVMHTLGVRSTAHWFLKPIDVYMLQDYYGDRTSYDVTHRYSTTGAVWNQYGAFNFDSGDPQDGVAMDVGWDSTSSGYFYVAAWSDPQLFDQVRIAYGDGVNWQNTPADLPASASVQVPAVALGKDGSAWYTVVAYVYGTSHVDSPDCGGTFCGGHGKSLFVDQTDDFGSTWAGALLVDENISGAALAHYGGDCFILAYAVWDNTSTNTQKDKIRTKVSCDGGLTWGSTVTSSIRTSDRPAIAWGDDGVWGGILWTTNVRDNGTSTGNHVRTGRLQNALGFMNVVASPAEASTLYTSSFPALTVSDTEHAQSRQYVRIRRRWNEVAGGRDIAAQRSTDLATPIWTAETILQSSRSYTSAAYSDWYNEYWTLYTQ